MAIGESHLEFTFAKIRWAREFECRYLKRTRGRVGCGGDDRGIWGEWIVVGQDGEDSSACQPQEFDASEDGVGDDAWGKRGRAGGCCRRRLLLPVASRDGGPGGWETVPAQADEHSYRGELWILSTGVGDTYFAGCAGERSTTSCATIIRKDVSNYDPKEFDVLHAMFGAARKGS